jgi:hypothetical protein
MNGGVVHAIGALTPDQLRSAVAGFEYFGLEAAASVLKERTDDTDQTEDRGAVPRAVEIQRRLG